MVTQRTILLIEPAMRVRRLWCTLGNFPTQRRLTCQLTISSCSQTSCQGAGRDLLWCRLSTCGGLLRHPKPSEIERCSSWLCVPGRIQHSSQSMSATPSCQQIANPPAALISRAAHKTRYTPRTALAQESTAYKQPCPLLPASSNAEGRFPTATYPHGVSPKFLLGCIPLARNVTQFCRRE
jgi:hypothetical protein